MVKNIFFVEKLIPEQFSANFLIATKGKISASYNFEILFDLNLYKIFLFERLSNYKLIKVNLLEI